MVKKHLDLDTVGCKSKEYKKILRLELKSEVFFSLRDKECIY